jgi:predicted nucleic acid-binding protein
MEIIKSLVTNLEKDMRYIPNEELQQIAGLEGMPGVDVGDAEFVRAAASVPGSILVTTDGPLSAAVNTNGIDRAQGFAIVSPAAALPMAGPDSGADS